MKNTDKTKTPTQYSLFDKTFDLQLQELKTAKRHHLSIVQNHPKAQKSSERYLAVVRQGGMKLAEVPDDSKNPEICLAAVQNNRLAFQFVPEKFKSIEVCVASLPLAWFDLPDPYKDIPAAVYNSEVFWDMAMQKLYLDAVKVSGKKLELVPEKGKTPEVCLIAVRRWGRALQFVPEKLKTPELCFAAIQQDVRAMEYVPKKYLFRLYVKGVLKNSNVPGILALQKISESKFFISD